MNTTDQTFIRAYGSDFIPSYADEAARAADYPALADCNANAVFGSLPQRHYRVDGPSTTPMAAHQRVSGGGLPAPLPSRPYVPRTAPARAASPAPQEQYAHLPPAGMPVASQLQRPLPLDAAAPRGTDPVEPHAPRQSDQADDMRRSPEVPADDAPPTSPTVTRGRVPRPHIDFAAARNDQPEKASAAANDEPLVDRPRGPSPAKSRYVLSAEDGLAVLADSSVLIGSSLFEWPDVEPALADPPIAAKAEIAKPVAPAANEAPAAISQPTEPSPSIEVSPPTAVKAPTAIEAPTSIEAPTAAKAPTVGGAAKPSEPAADAAPTPLATAESHVAAPVAAPPVAETPLGAAIANIDKEASGATLEADADAATPARRKLKPAWEVDRLLWPADADQLYESESEYFRHAGEKLRDASQEGLRVLAVSSTHAGEGCTTLAICLARAAAAAGSKVALLDANLRSPRLGPALGLDFAQSWHETLGGKIPLAEAAVTAIADNVTLIPLSQNALRQGLRLDADGVNDLLDQAGETFDLVIVDLGVPAEQGQSCFQIGQRCPLDAAIIVRDVRATSEEETLESVSRFRELGVDAVGIAENFASTSAARAAA